MSDLEKLHEFIQLLQDVRREYHSAQDAEKEADAQLQDIIHHLELHDDSYHETARLGKLIRQIRRERRKAKETVELLAPVDAWANENKAVIHSLERLLGTVCHIQEAQNKRVYRPRTEVLGREIMQGKRKNRGS